MRLFFHYSAVLFRIELVCCKTGVGADEPQTNCLDDNFSVCARIITKSAIRRNGEHNKRVGLVNANKHDKIKRNGFETCHKTRRKMGSYLS